MDRTSGYLGPYLGHLSFQPRAMVAMDKMSGINSSTDQELKSKPGKPKKRGALGWIGLILFWTGLSLVLIVAQALIALYLYWSHDVPTAAEIRGAGLAVNSEKYEGLNYPLPLAEIPPMVQKAFVATEDSGFYDHNRGQGLWGYIYWSYICSSGRAHCCGSTIVQQVARLKKPDTWRGRDWHIKLPILTWRLENGLTNDEILEIYLNQVYIGRGAYGVEAAARAFFGKSVTELSLAETVHLAATVRAPNIMTAYPDRARERRLYVLKWMQDLGFINEEQAEAAKAEEVVLKIKTVNN